MTLVHIWTLTENENKIKAYELFGPNSVHCQNEKKKKKTTEFPIT